MQYFLFETQSGGCGYTIGCGYRLRELPVQGMNEALQLLFNAKEGDRFYLDLGDEGISKAEILEVTQVGEVNIALLRREHEAEEELQAKQNQEVREKAEYERLKRKFKEKP